MVLLDRILFCPNFSAHSTLLTPDILSQGFSTFVVLTIQLTKTRFRLVMRIFQSSVADVGPSLEVCCNHLFNSLWHGPGLTAVFHHKLDVKLPNFTSVCWNPSGFAFLYES